MTRIDIELLKENIETLVNKRGESKTRAFINSGVGKDFFSNLNKGQIPSVEKIISLADYFGVSVDYLLGRTDEPNGTAVNVGNHSQVNVNSAPTIQTDDTTGELVTIFKSLKFGDKAKIMSLAAELCEKKGA